MPSSCPSLPWLTINHSVMSDSLWPHGLQLTRLLCPWNSPVKNTGVGSHSLLQRLFLTQGSNPVLLHCRQILYHLSHQGSPFTINSNNSPHLPAPWKTIQLFSFVLMQLRQPSVHSPFWLHPKPSRKIYRFWCQGPTRKALHVVDLKTVGALEFLELLGGSNIQPGWSSWM